MRLNYTDCSEALKARIDAALAGDTDSQCQHHEQVASSTKRNPFPQLVQLDCSLLVRITRRYAGREYDDDNLISGCKELRDAIALAFGRKGDSRKDGFEWEYRQEKWPQDETIIEVYEVA